MAYLTCKNLTLGYEGHAIVSDLNFKVGKGDYLCIVGENGTGKSTLIKTLLHLQDAISGEVMAGDGLKAYEVGYLPQQTVVQKDFPATVEEIVLSGTLAKCGWRLFYSKVEKRMAEEKEENGCLESSEVLLPKSFRRAAAENSFGKSIMCHE